MFRSRLLLSSVESKSTNIIPSWCIILIFFLIFNIFNILNWPAKTLGKLWKALEINIDFSWHFNICVMCMYYLYIEGTMYILDIVVSLMSRCHSIFNTVSFMKSRETKQNNTLVTTVMITLHCMTLWHCDRFNRSCRLPRSECRGWKLKSNLGATNQTWPSPAPAWLWRGEAGTFIRTLWWLWEAAMFCVI